MITIHEKTAQTFHTMGMGTLFPSSCFISEELNGLFELELEHPYDADGKWKRLEVGNIIVASAPRGKQAFRIYHIQPTMNNISVFARHIFYDLLDNYITACNVANGTAQQVLDSMVNNFNYTMPFSFSADLTGTNSFSVSSCNPVTALLGDGNDNDSIITKFGGEILRDNFSVQVLPSIGIDRGVSIRYGKNLKGLTVDEDVSEVVTRIFPFGKDGLKGTVADSSYISSYPYPKTAKIENTECTTTAQLAAYAQELFDSGIDLPKINIQVDFQLLSKTAEYKNYAVLEDVQLGDVVTVINNKIGFHKKAKVISYRWDCLLEKYEKVELGDFVETLATSITSGVRSGNRASAASASSSAVAAVLQAHMNDKNNPHNVTAEQTGGSGGTTEEAQEILYGTATPNDADGKDGDAYVKMRKEASGIDENTAFLLSDALADTSGNGVSITNNGVTTSDAQSKFGGKSLYFDGSSYLEAALAVEGDVTIDCWVYFTEHGSQWCTPFNLTSGSNRGLYMHIMSASIKLGASITGNDNADVEISEVLPFGIWHHIAIVRSGTNVYLFINGTKKGTMENSLTTNDKLVLGHLSSSASGTKYKGYMDELRVSKTARWTTNFTPPTEPYAKEATGELYIKINGTWELAMKGA